ncbi:hypothetical protein NLI96_g7348 [Meripilus lineatus]|uniref:Gpr1 family protein n=1 Tax=Meripilus lineatus TaxID=2056292 RepID=A0AAD5UZB5_9APHY|nr:hypothetical protein NLI96_g7348 [Physisporinus lineatus]
MSNIEKAELGSVGSGAHQVVSQPTGRKLGNPGPIGVFAFSSTTLVLSLYNAQARSITHPNVVVGMACFVGGLAQLLAGQWEIAVGNTFGATAFTLYGGFWMSYAAILIPGTGILAAYADYPDQLKSALAIYLLSWTILTFLLFLGTLRRSIAFILLFGALDITFLLLCVGDFTHNTSIVKAGGGMGVVTAIIGYYVGTSEILTRDRSYFQLPLGQIAPRLD